MIETFSRRKRMTGFTVVELVTVVSVIVILAAIILVAYPAYLMTTHDNARKSDIQQIASSLKAYALKNNTFVDSTSTDGSGNACGSNGSGNGWFNAGPPIVAYSASISSCLKNAGVLSKDIIDPSGCVSDTTECKTSGSTTAYMKVTCTKGGNPVTYVLAHLEGQQRRDAEVDALCDSGSVANFSSSTQKWGSLYGMNYYVTVK